MEKSRPSILFFLFFFSWEWGCMATVRSAMCVLSGAGPSDARPHLNKCFMERKRLCVFVWMRCQDNCNWSALLKNFVWVLQCMLVQSVCVCVCVCVCLSVCLCVCMCECMRVCWCPVCFSGVLTEALHGISSPPFGNTSLWRDKREKLYSWISSGRVSTKEKTADVDFFFISLSYKKMQH